MKSKNFIEVLTGFTDSQSGYGAQYPNSNAARAFLMGALDDCPTSNDFIEITRDYKTKKLTEESNAKLGRLMNFSQFLKRIAQELDSFIDKELKEGIN